MNRSIDVPGSHGQDERIRLLMLICLLCVVGLSIAYIPSAQASDPVAAGYRDFSYGTSGNAEPTGEKPESKLWWNDGFWWGSLYNHAAQAYHIYRLDLASQNWIDTGTVLDDRNSSKADTLWDGQHLYVASHVFTGNAVPTSSNWGRLYRYSYNAATDTYTKDAGFPVNVTRGRSEALVVDKDSTGQLWVTYVESGKVMVNRSLSSDLDWGTPFVLPVSAGSVTVTTDDISSVIAFQGNKIGVMWSNQSTKKMYFAIHLDSSPDNVWQAEQTALPGPNCSDLCADDHINLKSLQADSSGRVFAATKTSLTASNAPLIMLLVRDLSGNWSNAVFARVVDNLTRPIVLLDEEHGRIHMFASREGGGAVYYKSSDINSISFPSGQGTPFIQSATDTAINNATSTKQNLNSTTGLVVLASDRNTRNYLHNYLSLGSASATATPTNTPIVSNTPTPTATPTNTPIVSNTPTPTAAPTTPTSGIRIKDITFEDGSLTHPDSGADRIVGTVSLETANPLKGTYAAKIPNTATSYLEESFAGVDDLYVTFYVRLLALPSSNQRLAFISNNGTTVGNLFLFTDGTLRLRNGSTTIGSPSAPLSVGTLYRVGLRQKKGSASDAILQAFIAVGEASFGTPFAATSTGAWTTQADRLRVGATLSVTLDAIVDDIRLDSASMPQP
jgi:hypothetical protein